MQSVLWQRLRHSSQPSTTFFLHNAFRHDVPGISNVVLQMRQENGSSPKMRKVQVSPNFYLLESCTSDPLRLLYRTARYCSRECQKQHWPEHKPHCINHDKEMDPDYQQEVFKPYTRWLDKWRHTVEVWSFFASDCASFLCLHSHCWLGLMVIGC